jgi:hypothetical protein
MREKTPFSELSDADFVALLKESEKGSNWTLGQVAEYELRGPDFLANDKGLREKIDGVLTLNPGKEVLMQGERV